LGTCGNGERKRGESDESKLGKETEKRKEKKERGK